MGLFFEDPLHETFAANVALGTISRGGAEPGEIIATCARITDGDDDSWYDEWCATADHVAAAGRAAAAAGHAVSAREALLRASSYYGLAFHPLFGTPVDERLVAAFAGQRAAFEAAVDLLDVPGEAFEVDLDGATIPGWFFAAPGATLAPLLVATNGYDMGMPELYLGVAASALRRGYHCVVFDGPGQGRVLVEQGVPMRGDWEQVVTPVLDEVMDRPEVDTDRVALMGWSLGGYLALRAATAEPRLAACIADPGLYGIRESMIARLQALQVPDAVIAGLPELPADVLTAMEQFIGADRFQRWTIAQRGFWVHGVDSFAGYVRAAYDFSLAGHIDRITCPTLVTAADADPLSSTAEQVVADLISSDAELARFTADEGAGDHCEWRNRARFDQRAFDWLDEQFAGAG
jgi:pimeloyl-ACP methyl ester carboxylesterase